MTADDWPDERRITRLEVGYVVSAGDVWLATLGTLEDAERYCEESDSP